MISLLSFVVALAVQALFFYLATRITGNKPLTERCLRSR